MSKWPGIELKSTELGWNLPEGPDQCSDGYLSDASASDLKLAYIQTCSSLGTEVMNSLSMEERDRFHIHRLCRDNRTAFIVVRRGKINPGELVNMRTGTREHGGPDAVLKARDFAILMGVNTVSLPEKSQGDPRGPPVKTGQPWSLVLILVAIMAVWIRRKKKKRAELEDLAHFLNLPPSTRLTLFNEPTTVVYCGDR
ncbi:hypothetical protein B0H10DRAFT_1967751 [Mycena sp. CBHHK59/15]|nr:hypothetical protein B0H10DRAFT_1967751 [Mycena sp. CBHHK59/15]